MSYAKRITVDVTTDADGDATAYSAEELTGAVRLVRYVKDATTPFADGVDFTVTSEQTGQTIWAEENVNASTSRSPRQATHTNAGAAALYAAAGAAVLGDIVLAAERIKIVVGSGGDTKVGQFQFVVA